MQWVSVANLQQQEKPNCCLCWRYWISGKILNATPQKICLKMPMSKSCRMCVVCDGRHNIWPLLSRPNSITSIKMWTMAIRDQQYRSGRGDSAKKRIELLQKKICVDPPFSLFTNSVFAMAPSLNCMAWWLPSRHPRLTVCSPQALSYCRCRHSERLLRKTWCNLRFLTIG